MGYFNKNGYLVRIFLLNIIYTVFCFLSAIILATLNADVSDGTPRYKACQLSGTGDQYVKFSDGCIPLQSDTAVVLNNLVIIVSVALGTNALLLLHSILIRMDVWRPSASCFKLGTNVHFRLQHLFEVINIVLFSLLVGNLNGVQNMYSEKNQAHNIYMLEFNILIGCWAGVVLATLNFIISVILIDCVYPREQLERSPQVCVQVVDVQNSGLLF